MGNKEGSAGFSRSTADPTPFYFKLQMKIRTDIENGKLEPGELVPPEKQLAEIHGVSIGTVRTAILNLVSEGYLYRVRGKGTFVTGTKLRRESLKYYRYLSDFDSHDVELAIHVLGVRRKACLEPINKHLKLDIGQEVYELERYFTVNDKPGIHCLSYLSCDLFKGLDEFPASRFERVTLYTVIEESYGVPTIFNRELISVDLLQSHVANILQVPVGTPALRMEMLSYTYKEKPYEYRITQCLTDCKKIYREF